MEEDSSHVEMKLSSDMDEEVGGNGVVDNGKINHTRPSYVKRTSGLCSPRNICIAATVALLSCFLIGKKVNREQLTLITYTRNNTA